MLRGGGRRGMGGGGGGIMKTFQRAARAGVGGAPPNSNTTIGGVKRENAKAFNSKRPISPTNTALTSPYSSTTTFSPLINTPNLCSDESEWEYVDGIDEETAARAFYDNYVFGTVPSRDEVHHAVSALQQAICCSENEKVGEVASEEADDELKMHEVDWDEPSHSLYMSSTMLQHPRSDMAFDAFHLLQTEPSVQRMVVSLSSDQAVWEAVMNNEAVKELRGSIHGVSVESSNEEGSDAGDHNNILKWIVKFAKAKMMQVLEKMIELMKNAFHGTNKKQGDGNGDDGGSGSGVDERVKTSFFLSIVVLIMVVLGRASTNRP